MTEATDVDALDTPGSHAARRAAMGHIARAYVRDAADRTHRYVREGIVWQGVNYLLVVATAAGAAGGGVALGGIPWLAAVLAFTAAAAAAAAGPANLSVRRQVARKIHWRQVGRRAHVFLDVTLPNYPIEVVEAAFKELAVFVEEAEATELTA